MNIPHPQREELLKQWARRHADLLQRQGLNTSCVVCGSYCLSIRELTIDHTDFTLTIPLRICLRCGQQAPFQARSFLDHHGGSLFASFLGLLFLLGDEWGIAAFCVTVGTVLEWWEFRKQKALDRHPGRHVLEDLLRGSIEYDSLLRLYPDLQATEADRKTRNEGVGGWEADRFVRSIYIRRFVSFHVTEEEMRASQIPAVVMESYPLLIDALIQKIASEVALNAESLIQVAVALLPDRKLKHDLQLITNVEEIKSHEMRQRFEEELKQSPAWPLCSPLIFSVCRAIGRPPRSFYDQLDRPFRDLVRQCRPHESETISEVLCRHYQIEIAQQSEGFDETDIAALQQWLPENLNLRLFHATILRAKGDYAQALEIYDGIQQGRPFEPFLFSQRISTLAEWRHFERAAAECQKRISRSPNDAQAYYLLARIQLDLNCPEAALQAIDHSLTWNRSAESLNVKADVLFRLEKFDQAEYVVREALEVDPTHAAAHLLSAKLHIRAEELESALAALRRSRQSGTIYLETILLEANLLADRERLKEAKQLFRDLIGAQDRAVEFRMIYIDFLIQRGELQSAETECQYVLERLEDFAPAHVGLAQIYYLKESPDLAFEHADKSIALGSEDARAFLVRGAAKASCNDYEGASEDLDRCLELEPNYVFARVIRGRLHTSLDEHQAAIAEYVDALALDPDAVGILVERGYAYLGNEQNDEAQADFERAIELAPELADGYTGRAITHLLAGRKTEASADLDRAISLDPHDLCSRLNRVKLSLDQNELELAKEDLDQVLHDHPDSGHAIYQRAWVNLYRGEFQNSLKDFDRLVELDPQQPSAYIGRSIAREQSGDTENAEADLEKAKNEAPWETEEITFQHQLTAAQVANRNEQYDKAIELTTQLIEQHPVPIWEAYRLRGHSHWSNECLVEALDDYAKVIQDSEDATRHDFSAYGQILCELGDFERGLEALDRSIALAKETEETSGMAYSLNGRGRALTGLGRYEEAKESFYESEKINPDNAWLHFDRGLLYLELKDHEQARACFEHALQAESPRLSPRKRRRAEGFLTSSLGDSRNEQHR